MHTRLSKRRASAFNLLHPDLGLAGALFPEKIEGLAFGPNLQDGRINRCLDDVVDC